MNNKRQEDAANLLEELTMAMKESVLLLRAGQSTDGQAYALIYRLRTELGYVVNRMGRAGVPNTKDASWAKDHIDKAIEDE